MGLPGVPPMINTLAQPSDAIDGSSLWQIMLAIGVIFISISAVFVIIRVGTRVKLDLGLHVEDYLCIFGEAVGIAAWVLEYESMYAVCIFDGVEADDDNLTVTERRTVANPGSDIAARIFTTAELKTMVALLLLISIANGLAKVSILYFFVRLFGTLRWARNLCYGVLAATVAVYGAYEIAILAICIPAPGEPWDVMTVLARINHSLQPTVMLGVYNVLFDVTMLVLPLVIVARLQMQPERKRGLAVVFLIGFLIVVASVVGLAYRIVAVIPSRAMRSRNQANVSITSYAEIFGTVTVSCAPALLSFWTKIVVKSRLYARMRFRRQEGTKHIALEDL
ncbi:hypothetical protein PG991_000649 [Apiospora marii]|uniref:Rhodopsin domain-containing protein n=1 Tax=Apiospora marii TaxID=335849 RepID=A0ABR1SSK6_9PEZI